jgi:hypothetical protein
VKYLIGSAGREFINSQQYGYRRRVRKLIVLLPARREAGRRRTTHPCQASAVLIGRRTQTAISQRAELCFVEIWRSSSCVWHDCGLFALICRMHGAALIRSCTTRWRISAFHRFPCFSSKACLFCLTNGGWTRDMGIRIATAYSG